MIATNRITVIADLLLWVLNKPTKIPLGISFLPDLIQIITTHVKHKVPFEIVSMKDDLLEYLILCNIIPKFKQKYYNHLKVQNNHFYNKTKNYQLIIYYDKFYFDFQ